MEQFIDTLGYADAQLGVLLGMSLWLGAFSILFLKKWDLACKLAALGVLPMVLGAAAPVIVATLHPLIDGSPAVRWAVAIITCSVSCFVALVIYFVPSIIATQRKRENKRDIFLLNILIGLIPFGWNVVLFMSLMDKEKNQTLEGKKSKTYLEWAKLYSIASLSVSAAMFSPVLTVHGFPLGIITEFIPTLALLWLFISLAILFPYRKLSLPILAPGAYIMAANLLIGVISLNHMFHIVPADYIAMTLVLLVILYLPLTGWQFLYVNRRINNLSVMTS